MISSIDTGDDMGPNRWQTFVFSKQWWHNLLTHGWVEACFLEEKYFCDKYTFDDISSSAPG